MAPGRATGSWINARKLRGVFDRLAQSQVFGAVHLAHSATPQQAHDAVARGEDPPGRKACVVQWAKLRFPEDGPVTHVAFRRGGRIVADVRSPFYRLVLGFGAGPPRAPPTQADCTAAHHSADYDSGGGRVKETPHSTDARTHLRRADTTAPISRDRRRSRRRPPDGRARRAEVVAAQPPSLAEHVLRQTHDERSS